MNHSNWGSSVPLSSRLEAAKMLLDACLHAARSALNAAELKSPIPLPLSPLGRKVALLVATMLLACLFVVGELVMEFVGRQKQDVGFFARYASALDL